MKFNICVVSLIVLLSIQMASAATPIPDYDFDKNYNDLKASNLTFGNLSSVGAATYEDILGSIFWGILFALIFGMMWISMEDITVPSLLGMIIGGSIWSLMPPEWVTMAMSLVVVSFAGLVYSYIKRG